MLYCVWMCDRHTERPSTWSLCISACKEDDESESKLANQQHSLSSLHYNHYASKPMMYGEENLQQHQLQQQQGSSSGTGTIGTSASAVSVGSEGIVMQSVTPPMNLNGHPGYMYQIQQQPQPLQYGQYYSQTIATPPPLPQHTTLFIHETPVSLHQYVQQQPTSSLASQSLPTFVQHPTVYIHDNQMTIPAYTQQHAPGLPLPQNATTVYIQEMTKQPPPGMPPPPPHVPGQQSLYLQETLQHPPPGLHAHSAAGHPSTVILQDASQHPPPFLTAPPGSGQQSTIYIHESSMANSRILQAPPSTGLPPPTIYLQDASVSPQPYIQQPPNTALGTQMTAIQGSGAQQQSTIIIHETTLPSQQFVAPSAPHSLSSPLPSIQLQHMPPPYMPQQHNVVMPPPPLMQSQGSQPIYGQLAYASDYGSLPSYMTHQNALAPSVPSEDSSHVSDAHHYWMAAT